MDSICPICSNKYSRTQVPLKLECGHVSCQFCLIQRMIQGNGTYFCQLCNQKTTKDVRQLEPCLFLMEEENSRCTIHLMNFQHFCRQHNHKLCAVCLQQFHQNCQGILTIQQFNELQNQKRSQITQSLEQDYQNLIEKLRKVEIQRNLIQQQFDQQKGIFQDTQQYLVKNIITITNQIFSIQLDKYKKATETISNYKRQIQSIVQQISNLRNYKSTQIEEIEQKMQTIQQNINYSNMVESQIPMYKLDQLEKQQVLSQILENLNQSIQPLYTNSITGNLNSISQVSNKTSQLIFNKENQDLQVFNFRKVYINQQAIQTFSIQAEMQDSIEEIKQKI